MEEKKTSWMDDVMIEIPLKKFVKMKEKILRQEQEITDKRHNYYELRSQYDKLKEDYQKVLGIKEGEANEHTV